MAIDSVISFKDFLRTCPTDFKDTTMSFDNVGTFGFTTITRANLELLRCSTTNGYAGLIVCCPDFERESIAVCFLAALLHLEHDQGAPGLHEVKPGERVAIGSCVAVATDANDQRVMFRTADENVGFDKRYTNPPLVHTARIDAPLSNTRSTSKRKRISLRNAASQYEGVPRSVRHFLDICGKRVPSIVYCSSSSQYLNEPPTHIPNGSITIAGETSELSSLLPIAHYQSNGKIKNDFDFPFDVVPSILVCPRVDGIGTSHPVLDSINKGAVIDFAAFNIPNLDSLLETSMYTDFLDLKDAGIGVIGFCDSWTMNSVRQLRDENFLFFDWGDCSLAEESDVCELSPIQRTIKTRRQEKIIPVQDADSGLWRAKQILYDNLANKQLNTDAALAASANLFAILGAAIRMTEAPDEDYASEQREVVDVSLEAIAQSRSLSSSDFDELNEACEILKSIYQAGRRLPKERKIYDLITECIDNAQHVILVVDRNRTAPAYDYWCDKLSCNHYGTGLFRVVNTREYMAAKGMRGDETVIFSGWYDRGTMDRALHSGIASNLILVLYGHDSGGLELEWWKRAREQWETAAARCFDDTNNTLAALGIQKMTGAPKRSQGSIASYRHVDVPRECDDSPAGIIIKIERNRILSDLATTGEESVRAIPVMFNDGSHIWLRANKQEARGGRLVVINECLDGRDTEPEQKTAYALLPGDVVLRTHSDRTYIRKTSEQTIKDYDEVFAVAQKWRGPIRAAKSLGLTDAEIADKIYSAAKDSRTMQAVRGWVKGNRIAPQTIDDIRAVYSGLHCPVSDKDLNAIVRAVKLIRNEHRMVGRMAAKDMVSQFLADVRVYGLDNAVSGFDDRHEAGDIELLRVASVGREMSVAKDRAYVI